MNAGMEAIIEDEVTQRFVAEELKVRLVGYLVYSWFSNQFLLS